MLVYVALALGKAPHPVASRALLGLQGACVVCAARAAGGGVYLLLRWREGAAASTATTTSPFF